MANNNNNNKPTSKEGLVNRFIAGTTGPVNLSGGLNKIVDFLGGIPGALSNVGDNIIAGAEAAAPYLMYNPNQKSLIQQAIEYDQQKTAAKEAQKAQSLQQAPLTITPQQKAAFDAMMAEKAAGGSGNIAANQYGLQIPGRNSKVDENVVASKDAGEEIMAPTEGLTFDSNNAVQVDSNTNAETEGEPPILGGMENTVDNNAVANAILNAGSNTNNVDDITNNMIKQLMSTDGYVTPQQMQDLIKKEYEAIRDVNTQNPYYGGQYIQPGGYQIDPNELSRRQAEDEVLRRTAIYGGGNAYTGNLAQNYVDNQRQMYNAEMANRAGVPYEDYIKGMAERNANEVLIRAKEVEQQLTNYANQTNDMKVKLEVAQKLQANQISAQAKLDEIYANYIADSNLERIKGKNAIAQQLVTNAGNLDVRNAQDVADLVKTQYQLNHPTTTMKSFGSMAGSLALLFYQDPAQAANFLSALAPQYHKALFGKVMNPKDMKDVFTAQQMVKQNPSAFEDFLNKYNIFNKGQ